MRYTIFLIISTLLGIAHVNGRYGTPAASAFPIFKGAN